MSCGDRDIKQFENHLLLCRQFSQKNFRTVGRVNLLQPFQMRDNFRKCKIAFESGFIFPDPVLNFAINDQADHVHKPPSVESLLRLNPSALVLDEDARRIGSIGGYRPSRIPDGLRTVLKAEFAGGPDRMDEPFPANWLFE